jgi:hypothetical protein
MSATDKLLDFFQYHIHSADDHYVRWKWAVGSVAMWDNRYVSPQHVPSSLSSFLSLQSYPKLIPGRCVIHRVIPGTYEGNRKGIWTTVFGEKRKYNRAALFIPAHPS